MANEINRVDDDEQKPNRRGKVMSLYIDLDVVPALEAYVAAQKIIPTNKAIINYALKKFLTEEGFYPAKSKAKR